MPLEMCEGNWSAAEAKPSVVQALINKEIDSGWRQTAQLNLVEAPEKDPRLVLDSTVCQVNPNCSLPEAVQPPTVSDVCFSFQPWQHVDGGKPGLQSSPRASESQGAGPRHAPV